MNYVITPEPGYYNISPELFRRYAREYIECYRSYRPSLPYSPVPYFLLCRAIEFELKAVHLESMSRQQVKNDYGHNLKAAYDALPQPERPLDTEEYESLCLASKIYDVPNKGFEYVTVKDAVSGLRDFPDLSLLGRIASKLIHG